MDMFLNRTIFGTIFFSDTCGFPGFSKLWGDKKRILVGNPELLYFMIPLPKFKVGPTTYKRRLMNPLSRFF